MSKKSLFSVILFSFLFLSTVFYASAYASDSPNTIISKAIDVLREITEQQDSDTMAKIIDEGHGVAIVPSMVKAGFIVGGQHGYGLILGRKGKQWYGPSFFEMSGGSIGLQIGVQSVALLFCINNEAGMKAFSDSKAKLGANVGIAAGPVGREAGAATDGNLKASIYSYSMAKGLFAGVDLDGTAVGASKKLNRDFWGKDFSVEEALKQKATKSETKQLIAELNKIIKKHNAK